MSLLSDRLVKEIRLKIAQVLSLACRASVLSRRTSFSQPKAAGHFASLYELQLSSVCLAILAPALETAHLTTETAAIYRSGRSRPYTYPKPYTYTKLLRNGKPLCCLLHIDNQFVKALSYFDNLVVMLQAFPPDQELIVFLDTSCFPPILIRRLLESEGRVRYIALSSSKNDSLCWLIDALGLDEKIFSWATLEG